MLEKPPSCMGCQLEHSGYGYSRPIGPIDPQITFVGGAPDKSVIDAGEVFTGQQGAYLNRTLGLLGLNRNQFRMGNVINCRPPRDWLTGSPWESSAIRQCITKRTENFYAFPPKVYITLGVPATRTILNEVHQISYAGRIENWQAYVCGEAPPYVIPTYHPADLISGQQRLLGSLVYAVQKATEIVNGGFERKPVSLVVDPPPEWFDAWVDTVTPESWLSVDVETLMKSEDEESLDETVGALIRINFSTHPDQGITVPWDQRYLPAVTRLLSEPTVKVFWNSRFDLQVLKDAGVKPSGIVMDGMWAWHMLQSNLPRGLGFASAYYSDLAPWKHLNQDAPGMYAALDAVQTTRCMFGIAKDLQKAGQWETFLNHIVKFDANVLTPMEEAGLKLDIPRLRAFHDELAQRSKSLLEKIQARVPQEMLPLVGGWKTNQPGSFPRTIKKLAYVCTDCGAQDVTAKHKCKKG